MNEIEVIRSADEHWYEIRWNSVVEYKGEKYVICVEETPKWGNRSLHHYDTCRRYDIGDEVESDEIYADIIETIETEVGLSQGEFCKGVCFGGDPDTESTPPLYIPDFSKKTE
jgi:hypothetical protein